MATDSKYDITEVDAVTQQSIVRPMTVEEQSNHEIVIADLEKHKESVLAKAVAKQSVLDKLGLTSDEAALLLG